jgi:hypothetical protein
MSDGIVKDPVAIALDDVTARTGELVELVRAVEESAHAPQVAAGLSPLRAQIEVALDAVLEARQAHGELPAVGNLERAQFAGLAVRLESLFAGSAAPGQIATRLAAACEEILQLIRTGARAAPDASLKSRLDGLAGEVRRLRAALSND